VQTLEPSLVLRGPFPRLGNVHTIIGLKIEPGLAAASSSVARGALHDVKMTHASAAFSRAFGGEESVK
jgi:hypothetical protein